MYEVTATITGDWRYGTCVKCGRLNVYTTPQARGWICAGCILNTPPPPVPGGEGDMPRHLPERPLAPLPERETLDEMRTKPYRGPFLHVEATISMSGDNALDHALLLRRLGVAVNSMAHFGSDPDMASAGDYSKLYREANEAAAELERIGKLAKSREGRERL